MAGIKEYKCPCCGGSIAFNTTAQKLKCPYCDTEYEMENLAEYDQEVESDALGDMTWNNENAQEWTESDTEGLRVYSCKSCGGQVVGDENMAASTCPYCDSPMVILGQVMGGLKPEYVIPFKFDKEAAKRKFYDHMSGKKLLPATFKSMSHIDEIKGVYVPYWLYDSKADARVRYRATKVKRWSDNEYDYKETETYSVVRAGNIEYGHVPVNGSKKLDDEILESVEPFKFEDAVAFNPSYCAGYYADKYDKTSEECAPRANERIINSTETAFRETVKGYDDVTREGGNIRLNGGEVAYAMYPVWMLNTAWSGKRYMFAMNGETGKFVGDLPVDKKAAKVWLFGLTVVLAAVIFGLMALLGKGPINFGKNIGTALIIGFIISLIYNIILKSSMKSVAYNDEADDYIVPGSLHLTESKDIYLYKKLEKTKKAQSSANNSSK